jgi:hypothetical protein
MRPTIPLLSVCIRYRRNISTQPLPSNDKGIFTETLPSNYEYMGEYTGARTHTHSNVIL